MFVYCTISKDITRIFSWKLVSGPSGVDNASYMLKYCLGEEWPIESLSTPFFNQRGGGTLCVENTEFVNQHSKNCPQMFSAV